MKIGLWEIRHGDRVTIRDRFGAERTTSKDRAVLIRALAAVTRMRDAIAKARRI